MLRVIEAAASYDLTTLDAARAECGVTGASQDAALLDLIRAASDAIARHCGTPFGRETVEQIERPHCGAEVIILDRFGEIEILEIEEGTVAVADGGWEVDGRLLRRLLSDVPHCWSGPRVRIRYRAGWALMDGLPWDVERAALQTVAAWWGMRSRPAGLRAETVEGMGTLAYAVPTPGATAIPMAGAQAIPPEAMALLLPYRRIGI